MGKACIFLAALAIFAYQYECSNLEPQIKMIRAQLWYVNPEYVRTLWYNVQKHNQTYNDIGLHWEVLKDLPINLRVQTKIYVTNSTFGDEKLLLEDVTQICRDDPHHDFLPNLVRLDKDQLNGRCIKKGIYDMKDMGQYRYEELLPNIDQLGKYYKTDSVLGSDDETVLIVSFYSIWGYLKDTITDIPKGN